MTVYYVSIFFFPQKTAATSPCAGNIGPLVQCPLYSGKPLTSFWNAKDQLVDYLRGSDGFTPPRIPTKKFDSPLEEHLRTPRTDITALVALLQEEVQRDIRDQAAQNYYLHILLWQLHGFSQQHLDNSGLANMNILPIKGRWERPKNVYLLEQSKQFVSKTTAPQICLADFEGLALGPFKVRIGEH